MRLGVVEGRTYLEGWCLRAESVRLFRLDRVLAITVLDEAASVPPEAEPVDVDQGLFRPSPDDVAVRLELAPLGRWVAEYYPCDEVIELGEGRLRVTLRTPDTRWVRPAGAAAGRGRDGHRARRAGRADPLGRVSGPGPVHLSKLDGTGPHVRRGCFCSIRPIQSADWARSTRSWQVSPGSPGGDDRGVRWKLACRLPLK